MAISVLTIVAGTAIPFAHAAVDQSRAAAAASYMAGLMAKSRFEAVRRSAFVAIRFVESADGYWLRSFVDGNGNGVRSLDISRGIDRPISASEKLDFHFPGVTFAIAPTVTNPDAGEPFDTSDPIQIGATPLLSFSPNGSATSGTLFIRGQRLSQFAVRILGATGRTRVFQFNFEERIWRKR